MHLVNNWIRCACQVRLEVLLEMLCMAPQLAHLFPCSSVDEAHNAIGLPHSGEVRAMDRSGIGG